MRVHDLKSTFQYGMHGCGSYLGTYHVNSLEAFHYWLSRGVKVFEIDMAITIDDKFVALAHIMDAHSLKSVEINPYQDNSKDKFSEAWFMRNKLCEKSTGGLTPMNLESIIVELAHNPEIIVMFDLWGMWDYKITNTFSKQLVNLASEDVKQRCIIEVYNKQMLLGIKDYCQSLNIMYCVHGSSAKEFDENVSPELLKSFGVDIISYPWVCVKDHPGELENYHESGFTIFSLSKDNRFRREMQKAGVNVNLVDLIYKNKCEEYLDKVRARIKRLINKNERLSVIREMSLDDQHNVALEIMKEIHEFCINNEIQYSLAYGSLLGAIRHKGFIPWDDDIDIWMTRPNFEKFTKTFKSKKGYRHLSIYDTDSLICFDRVYETEHTYVKNMPKACNGKTGIWVDIMLLENVPDDITIRNNQYGQFAMLNKKVDIYRGWLTNRENLDTVTIIKVLIKMFVKGEIGYIRRNKIHSFHEAQLELIKKYSNMPSSNYCFFQCGVLYRNQPQELLPTECFNSYRLTKFEDADFMIVEDYDTLLKGLFGEYMTPPSADQRQKSHGICFWK